MDWRRRFFGDSVAGTMVRLALLSVVVGVVVSALGIDLRNIPYHLQLLARRIYELGFGVVEWLFHYLAIGAIVVIPIWIVVRLVRRDPRP